MKRAFIRKSLITVGLNHLPKVIRYAVSAFVVLGFHTSAGADDFGLIDKDGNILAKPIYGRISKS